MDEEKKDETSEVAAEVGAEAENTEEGIEPAPVDTGNGEVEG